MITIIDNRTDEVLDEIHENDKILAAEHTQDAESKEETLDFTFRGHFEGIKTRNRLLIKDDDNQYREFVIENIEQTDDEIDVFSNASYLEDLNNAMPIEPGGKKGLTTGEWIEYALTGTDWESGVVEFDGIRTINWTGYNTPYELLTIISNRFDMTLRFRVETDGKKVTSRFVDLVKVNHLFNGKEIVRGKDLIEFKRSENTEDIATALIALGPQPEEGKQRLVEILIDDAANDKFNKRGKYNWKIYEPESEDENMTRARLKSLAKTELNKRKEPLIDYSISAINLEHLYGHEKVRLYDKVRIKDEELDRYAEANTKKITRNLLDITDREFVFGDIVEYQRETLRAYFNSIINELKQRLENMPNTIDNIIEIVTNSELFERKISKSETPPVNPEDGDFWLDISDSEVGVLYRWENGKWVKSSVTQAEEIGAVTREAAMYDNIKNTIELLTMLHSNLMSEYYAIMENEYFIDDALKNSLTAAYDISDGHFNAVITKFNSMTVDTATMGRLIETLQLITDYRATLNTVRMHLVAAQQEIDRYFALLQSQYSEEKYNEILNEVAETFGLDVVDDKLVGDIIFIENMNAIKDDLQQQLDAAKQAFDELDIGARNLSINTLERINAARNTGVSSDNFNYVTYYTTEPIQSGKDYTISGFAEITDGDFDAVTVYEFPAGNRKDAVLEEGGYFSTTIRARGNGTDRFLIYNGLSGNTRGNGVIFKKVKVEKGNVATDWTPAPEDTDNKITKINQSITNIEGQLKSTVNKDTFDLLNETVTKQGTTLEQTATQLQSKAEKSYVDTVNNTVQNQGTQITQNATDIQSKAEQSNLDAANNKITQQGTLISQNAQEIALRAKTSDLNAVTGRVTKAEADIKINAGEISSRVKDVDYQTDKNGIISRLSGAESSITQQSNLISQKVGSTELTQAVNAAEKSAKDYADAEIDNIEIGGTNLFVNSTTWDSPWDTGSNYIKNKEDAFGGNQGLLIKGSASIFGYNYAHSNSEKWRLGNYIFSAWMKTTTPHSPRFGYRNGVGMIYGNIPLTTEWQKIEMPFTTTDVTDVGRIIYFYPNADIYISHPKLEYGNKATAWTPAPEDVDAQIKANENRIISHDTKFEQTDTQLSLKATMTDVNKSDKTLSQAISELVIDTANGLKFNYDSNGKLASYSVGKDGIQFEGSKIRFKAQDSIMLQIADAKKAGDDAQSTIDNLDLSGTNLVSGTNFAIKENVDRLDGAIGGASYTSENEYLLVLHNNLSADATFGLRTFRDDFKLKQGAEYTLSFEAYTNVNANNDFVYVYLYRYGASNQGRFVMNKELIGTAGGSTGIGYDLYRYTTTFTNTTGTEPANLLIGTRGTGYSWFRIKNVMLTRGKVAVPYNVQGHKVVDTDSLIPTINGDKNGWSISGNKISLKGTAEFNSALGSSRGITAIDGGKIETMQMTARQVRIVTSSGREVMIDGYDKGNRSVSKMTPHSMNTNARIGATGSSRQYIVTESSSYIRADAFVFSHTARYLMVNITLNTLSSAPAVRARLRWRRGTTDVYSGQARETRENIQDEGLNYDKVLILDMGEPLDYGAKQIVYVDFRTEGGSNATGGIRVGSVELTDFPPTETL